MAGSEWAAVEGSGSVLLSRVEDSGDEEGMGDSEVMARRVSAATMPPIEWPMRMVWTEGSMVGDGVEAATSRSMTLFWSLYSFFKCSVFHRPSLTDMTMASQAPVKCFAIRGSTDHSRNRPTHSLRSPRVSNFG